MKVLIVYVMLFFLTSPSMIFGQEKELSREELLSDLDYLKEKLVRHHANLFVYSTEDQFQSFLTGLKKSVNDRLDVFEAYSLISKTSSIIKDGHTLFHHPAERIAYFNAEKAFLPFQVYWDGEGLFIYKTFSESSDVAEGDEILELNSVPANELIKDMLSMLMRDGNNLEYPLWIINNFFSEYYSYFYGHPLKFEMQILRNGQNEERVIVEAENKTEIARVKNALYTKPSENLAIDIEFLSGYETAILQIKSWDDAVLKKYYDQRFTKAFESAFDQIFENKTQNLIVDLRDNQGGDLKNGKLFMSYILDSPFRMVEDYKKVNRKHELVTFNGPQKGVHKVCKKVFRGKIYILTNGGSFSNSGIVTSRLQKYNRVTVIGSETGGSRNILCGDIKKFVLPNSKISVDIPTLQFLIRPNISEELSGVIPDYTILPTIEDLINGRDKALEFAKELAEQ